MMGFLKKLFSGAPSKDFKQMVSEGAVIVDVRTRQEYQSGNIKGSINIPLNELSGSLNKLNPARPVITCCASGMRSARACSLLKSSGFLEVHNGGGWSSLDRRIN
jgi:rhodanese-related sulfurtransferase